MTTGQKMKLRRKELGIPVETIAGALNVSIATVYRYENGEIEKLPGSILEPLAHVLQTTPAYLMDWETEEPSAVTDRFPVPNITDDYTTFPVVGDIAAGYDSVAVEDWEGEVIDVPNNYLKGHDKSEFFVLRVKGDSMYPTYQDGDKVLILKQTTLGFSGQVGAILYEDENATLKKVEFVPGEDWLRLVPINANYPPKRIEGEELEHCRVIGIPRLLIREIED